MWIFKRHILLCFSLAVLLVSCRGGDEGVGMYPGDMDGVAKSLSVSIIPRPPTVTTDLRAVISGVAGEVSYRWLLNGEAIEDASGALLSQGIFSKGDTVAVMVASGQIEASSRVTIGNSPPVVSGVTITPEVVRSGVEIRAHPRSADPDNDFVAYEYRWFVNGTELFVFSDNVLDGSRFKRGDSVVLTITPHDGEVTGSTFTTRPIPVSNAPPVFTSVPPGRFSGRTYSYRAEARDPDGDEIGFTLGKAPESMTIDRSGNIQWTIKDGEQGTHPIEVVANDGHGLKAIQSYEILIEIP